jgi:hypothetical protein
LVRRDNQTGAPSGSRVTTYYWLKEVVSVESNVYGRGCQNSGRFQNRIAQIFTPPASALKSLK